MLRYVTVTSSTVRRAGSEVEVDSALRGAGVASCQNEPTFPRDDFTSNINSVNGSSDSLPDGAQCEPGYSPVTDSLAPSRLSCSKGPISKLLKCTRYLSELILYCSKDCQVSIHAWTSLTAPT